MTLKPPNTIQGTRCVNGLRIKFSAVCLNGDWEVHVMDDRGDLAIDFANDLDPMMVFGVIAEMIEAAIETSRATLKEMAGAD